MKRGVIGIPFILICMATDPCDELCALDGSALCTDGSMAIEGAFCSLYFIKPNGERCYRNHNTMESCLESFPVLSIENANEIIHSHIIANLPFSAGSPQVPSHAKIQSIQAHHQTNEPLSVLDIDKNGLNAIGRAVGEAVPSGHFLEVVRQIARMIEDDVHGDLKGPEDYKDVWIQSQGPLILEAARKVTCGAMAYYEKNACFAYMIFATHIRLPTGSQEYKQADNYLGLSKFVIDRKQELKEMLESSNVPKQTAIQGGKAQYALIESFANNWMQRCSELVNSPSLKELVLKHRIYRYSEVYDPKGTKRLVLSDIRREHALIDSFNVLNGNVARIRRGISSCEFLNEDAVGDGVIRDWFTTVSRQIFSSKYGMFETLKSGHMVISSKSRHRNPEMMKAVGRFLALALVYGAPIGVKIPQSFYARLIDQDVTIDMIKEFDEELAGSIKFIQTATKDDLVVVETPLTNSGFEENLTIENRDEQIRAACNSEGINNQIDSFAILATAFREVLPVDGILRGFTPKDIQDFLYGNQMIDIDDFEKNIVFGGGLTIDSDEVKWLIEILKELNQEKRREFVRFVTGYAQVPFDGFGAMNPKIQITRSLREVDSLPLSHTCFKMLELPIYSNKEKMKDVMVLAIGNNDAGMSENIPEDPIVHIVNEDEVPQNLIVQNEEPIGNHHNLQGIPDFNNGPEIHNLLDNVQLFGYDPDSPQIEWLVEIFNDLDQPQRRRFIYFITHDPQFSLESPITVLKWFDDRLVPLATVSRERELYLSPMYVDKETLRQAVMVAIYDNLNLGNQIYMDLNFDFLD